MPNDGGGGSRSSAVRSLHIPAYRRNPGVLAPVAAEEKWRILDKSITQIFLQQPGKLSFQSLYTEVYHLMHHQYEERLQRGLTTSLQSHVLTMKNAVMKVSDTVFLETLIDTWKKYKNSVSMVRDVFMYYEKYCGINGTKVNTLGVELFGRYLLKDPEVATRIKRLTNEIIQRERLGESDPTGQYLVKDITNMMCDVSVDGVYEPLLEVHFLNATREFCEAEATKVFAASTTPQYIVSVFRRIEQEQVRVERSLSPTTLPKIKKVIKDKMLVEYIQQLLEKEDSGAVSILKNWALDHLALLYQAVHVINQTDLLLEIITRFLLEDGSRFIQEREMNENPVQLVDGILKRRELYDNLLDQACSYTVEKVGTSVPKRQRDKTFEKEIKQSFVLVVNKNNRFAEFLSTAVDAKLRKRGVTDDECDAYFDRIIILFQYLQDKDIFERYYKQHLAKRLLLSKQVGEEGERLFIAKLKAESGHHFTTKIEGMFNDMANSQENMNAYKTYCQNQGISTTPELSVQVLTTGFWPLTKFATDVPLPPSLESAKKVFHNYYFSKHTGRRLTWLTSTGNADVKYLIGSRKYEMNVHVLQAIILLVFNTRDDITLQKLEELTEIPLTELKRQVLSLTMLTKNYGRILTKSCAQSKAMNGDTVVSINKDFSSKHCKFKVSSVVLKETEEQAKATRGAVGEDRKWQIDAIIVRIMKSRKVMEHRNLVVEVAKLASVFTPSPDDIKKRIESLLEREYIERSSESRSTYVYLA